MAELCSKITPARGGVMTDEVGVITGDLELCTSCDADGGVQVSVRYQGAGEWYALSSANCTLTAPATVGVGYPAGLDAKETSMAELCSKITPARGGVMTDEVGVITGDLELCTSCDADGGVQVSVRYQGAGEWYALSSANCTLHDARDHEAVHQALVGVLHRPEG
ncbi:hypothetical protein TL08_26175 [Actinoalloteichus hymeniacidonis]|uniref:Uncharacterized protein n=3 Tax=Actinoalloteichus hymeniacidonis TaxID=340345 RepID=A0AAC9HUT0_9PSEU|nr:hypothetical protein TL08_26175 [Actinoalloteichus hymeniacidonis]